MNAMRDDTMIESPDTAFELNPLALELRLHTGTGRKSGNVFSNEVNAALIETQPNLGRKSSNLYWRFGQCSADTRHLGSYLYS